MKQFLVCCLLLAAGCAPLTTPSQESAVKVEEAKTILPYTVEIGPNIRKKYGTGTVIAHMAHGSLILTCYHVIEGHKTVLIQWGDTTLEGMVVATDDIRDLALVKVNERLPRARLFFGALSNGEPELTVGNPFGHGLLITGGYVGPPVDFFREGSASVYPGNSGGGVYVERDGKHVLAGVMGAVARYDIRPHSKVIASTVHFSIPMRDVREFLNEHGLADKP